MFSLRSKRSKIFEGKMLIGYWLKYYRILFILLFISSACGGVFVWYQTIERFDWTNTQSSGYSGLRSQEVSLKEKEFKKATEDMQKRADLFNTNLSAVRDIFAK